MAEYSREQLVSALRNAHNSGDERAAKVIAGRIQTLGQAQQSNIGQQDEPEPVRAQSVEPQAPIEIPQSRVSTQEPETDALGDMLSSVKQDSKKIRSGAYSYGTQQPEQSFSYRTTKDQAMRPIEGARTIGSAPELNEMSVAAFKTSLGLLTEGDPDRAQQVIQSNIPDATFRVDEQGNRIAVLPSGEYIFDSPDLDAQDIARGIVDVAAFTPAGRALTIPRAVGTAAATELGLEGLTQAAGGGEVDLGDVALAGAFGGGGKALENVISTGYRLAKGVPEGDAKDLVDFAESQGVPLYTTDIDAPRTFVGKQAQSAAEKIPFAGTGAMREGQQKARSKLVEDFTSKFGDYNPQEVFDSLQSQTNKVKQAAGRARQNIMEQVVDVDVPTNNAIDAIDTEINRLTTSPKGKQKATVDQSTVDALNRYKEDLINDPSFENLESLRTQFRVDVKGERAVLNNRSEAAMNRIYSAMTKDLNETVELSLGSQAADKWRKSNAVYANEINKIKNTRLKGVLQRGELTPETVNNLLFSSKPSEVKTLYNSLNAKGKRAARAGLIAKAVEKSGDSPQKFLSEVRKLEKPLGIALTRNDRAYLKGLRRYLEATSQAAQAEVVTPTGQQLFQVAVPAGIATDVGTTGGLSTIGAGFYGLMARAYESKPVRNAVIRLQSVSPDSDEYLRRLGEVSNVLRTLSQAGRRQEDE